MSEWQNHSSGPWPGRLAPSSHQRSERSNSILGTFSRGDKKRLEVYSNPVGWCRGNIAAQKKVNYGKVEVILFVTKPGSELSIVRIEITIQVWSGCCSLCCFFYLQFTWIDEIQILRILRIIQRQYIIYIPVCEIELLGKAFLTLYKVHRTQYEYKNKSASNVAHSSGKCHF